MAHSFAEDLFFGHPPLTPVRLRDFGEDPGATPLAQPSQERQSSPAPKRRRLRQKQAAPSCYKSLQSEPLARPDVCSEESSLAEAADAATPPRPQLELPEPVATTPPTPQEYQRFHARFRRWLKAEGLVPKDDSDGLQPQRLLRNHDGAGKASMVQKWANADTKCPEGFRDKFVNWFQDKSGKETSAEWLFNQQALLTWNGPWGQFDLSVLQGRWLDVDAACAVLQETEEVQSLVKDVEEKMKEWQGKWCMAMSAWSVELSTTTYTNAKNAATTASEAPTQPLATSLPLANHLASMEPLAHTQHDDDDEPEDEGKPLRLHVHAYFRFPKRVHVKSSSAFLFRGSHPILSSVTTSARGRVRASGNEGMYYVQAPKLGSVASGGSSKRFSGYLVNPDWVWNLLQGEKLSLTSARSEFVSIGKNLPRNLEVLDKLQKEQERIAMEATVVEVQRTLQLKTCEVVRINAVDTWLASFSEITWRYKFLVLDGPSRTGKTVFCRSLSPDPTRFLEVDCAGSLDPDMREYRSKTHDFVLFDEGSAWMVVKYKKLFQASASWVTCGSSSTNMFAYKLWVHQKKLMIASNRWSEELGTMPREDSDWLRQNSVYVRITAPLWRTGSEPLARSLAPPCTQSVLTLQ